MKNEQKMMMQMMMQILRNQYVLLHASQLSNMSDGDEKVRIFEVTSSEASNTRFLIHELEKEMKNDK